MAGMPEDGANIADNKTAFISNLKYVLVVNRDTTVIKIIKKVGKKASIDMHIHQNIEK